MSKSCRYIPIMLNDQRNPRNQPSIKHPGHWLSLSHYTCKPTSSVVERIGWVSQVEDHAAMWLRTPTFRELLGEVNGPVEAQASIRSDIDVQSLEVCWGVYDAYIASLHEVVGDDDVFLIWCDLDILCMILALSSLDQGIVTYVRTDCWLDLIWIIQSLDVIEVRDIESSDMICCSQSEISKFAVLSEIGAEVVS